MGSVTALFVKPVKAGPMQPVGEQRFLHGRGIDGDVHADTRSTRQVLITAAESAQRLGVAPGALRENVCVADLAVYALTSGTVLQIGTAQVRLSYPCDPCGLLRSYSGIAPAAAKGLRGMLGIVVGPGAARVGDDVGVASGGYPALDHDWHTRLAWFLSRLPADRFLTYGDLALAVGEPRSVARTLPKMLAAPAFAGLPVERVVTAQELAQVGGADVRWAYWEALYQPLLS